MHPIFRAFLAQTAGVEAAPNPIVSFLPFIAIIVVFYFIFFRPQAKQQKKHQAYLAELKKGDEVVTQSGIIAKVVLVEDRTVTLDVGAGNKIRVLKAQVAGAWLEKPAEPAKAEAKK
ncbi:MAG TPA: preprotein translocase subunit YajC [Anaeromyxobacteraceae bacterium]|jgi:preprotein translocase subunit YajC|nr:preprotein translocase subunit YajC [Anaeromyxobacteraceae bacterium]